PVAEPEIRAPAPNGWARLDDRRFLRKPMAANTARTKLKNARKSLALAMQAKTKLVATLKADFETAIRREAIAKATNDAAQDAVRALNSRLGAAISDRTKWIGTSAELAKLLQTYGNEDAPTLPFMMQKVFNTAVELSRIDVARREADARVAVAEQKKAEAEQKKAEAEQRKAAGAESLKKAQEAVRKANGRLQEAALKTVEAVVKKAECKSKDCK
ncbi:MAG: hypothetical protein AAF550_11745, partial [Myxococcota bacterium]